MFGELHDRAFVQKVYLLNDKNFERTLEMFITENLPPVDEQPKLTMIETAPNSEPSKQPGLSMIDTRQKPASAKTGAAGGQNSGVDMRSYVLDQYKEVLFPKAKNKF